ncbi:MAG: TetR/AcrR family transcriptional regulator [Planctomycetota bacterium]|nr:MAG: TetR/AcrR family transcriptional regulator [Planctomycetota bacterium]
MAKKKTEKTRQKILATAERLFTRYGFKKTTIGDICYEGRVSRQTFYRYYLDKEELLVGYIMHLTAGFLASFEREAQKRETAVDRMKLLIFEYEELARSSTVLKMLYDLGSDVLWRWSQRSESRDQMRQIVDTFAGVIRFGVEKGEFPECNIEWTAYYIYQLLNNAFFATPSLYPDVIKSREEEFSAEVTSFILRALMHPMPDGYEIYGRD